MSIIIKNIKGIVQAGDVNKPFIAGNDMAVLPVIEDGWIMVEGDRIAGLGRMSDYSLVEDRYDVTDAEGRFVFPSFCDSHTHLVYAGSREMEYSDKIKGLSYEDIAKRGGGILNSSELLHATSEDELYEQSVIRAREIISQGTGAVEVKSGYGLSTESELKMLRVIKRISESTPLTVKATFLGAHAVPLRFRNNREGYIDQIISEMIPAVADEGLASFIDVFCDRGFFTPEETEKILTSGANYGLIPKIHANELDFSGGIQVGVKHGALSVDHLEFTGKDEIKALLGSGTMATLLPGAAFFLGMNNPPARDMIDSGLAVALASDYNPGSSPSGNMKLAMSLASIMLKMMPEEVINAATINGAYAMGLQESHGSITPGKIANLFISKEMPGYQYFTYAFGSDLVERVMLNGEWWGEG